MVPNGELRSLETYVLSVFCNQVTRDHQLPQHIQTHDATKTPTGQSNFDQPWQDLEIPKVTKSLWTQALPGSVSANPHWTMHYVSSKDKLAHSKFIIDK